MSEDKNNNNVNENNKEKKQKEPYNGSKSPFVLDRNLKTTKSIDAALSRIKIRFDWIKKRNVEIQKEFADPNTPAHTKKDLHAENKKLAGNVTTLIEKEKLLKEKRPEIEAEEQNEVAGMEIPDIEIPE